MTHHKVDSSNVHSIGHEHDVLEIRFRCGACKGSGAEFPGHPRTEKCERCDGTGHTGTYRYVGVPATLYAKVATGEPAVPGGKPSVGSAYFRLIRSTGLFKEEKVK